MGVAIRKEDGIEEPLSYGPRWVCHTPEQSTFAHALATKLGIADVSETTSRTTNAPRMAPGIGGHNIDPPPLRLSPFKGDVAIKDRRDQLSFTQDLIPQPPIRTNGSVAAHRDPTAHATETARATETHGRFALLELEVVQLRARVEELRRDRDAWREQAQRLALPAQVPAR
jgi:hypothetical protein